MPIDPVQLATWLNIIIPWCQDGLNGWGGKVIPIAVRNAMASTLATAQAFVASPRWPVWIASLNGGNDVPDR